MTFCNIYWTFLWLYLDVCHIICLSIVLWNDWTALFQDQIYQSVSVLFYVCSQRGDDIRPNQNYTNLLTALLTNNLSIKIITSVLHKICVMWRWHSWAFCNQASSGNESLWAVAFTYEQHVTSTNLDVNKNRLKFNFAQYKLPQCSVHCTGTCLQLGTPLTLACKQIYAVFYKQNFMDTVL